MRPRPPWGTPPHFGVSATDPSTYVVTVGLAVAVALLIALLPGTRADPVIVLRSE